MSHQVSISYHGAGTKASEIASSVGLGWTLNAGGVITRSVRGASDERIYDGQLTGYWLDGVNTAWFNNSAQRDQIKQGRRDIQSDLYFYNFAGYTGSFYFDQAKNVVQRNETDLIIKQYRPHIFTIDGYGKSPRLMDQSIILETPVIQMV